MNAHMFLSDHNNYLTTPEGLLAQHRQRARRRIRFSIDDIEPSAKHVMGDRDKDEVQRQLLKWLVDLGRKAYRGPLALRLTFATTVRNPPHIHQITKNLLDLFGKPRSALSTRRKALLYSDDRQIHALAVTCHHGESAPTISVVASPLGSLLADLDLAANSNHGRDRDDCWREDSTLAERAIEEVRDLLTRETTFRQTISDRAFESMLWCARLQAQEQLLERAAVTPADIARIYNIPATALDIDVAQIWEQVLAFSPLRIHLSELPQIKDASTLWKEEIDRKLRDFKSRLGWLIDPLLVPVALEVLIKPPPPSRYNNITDLDNVLRKYLIPRVVQIVRPVTDIAFTLDAATLRRGTPALSDNSRSGTRNGISTPPASTKAGVIRYEAWRLPPAKEGSKGFVSVALVADIAGYGDTFRRIDDEIDVWRETLEG
jgi:hypothetical protein